MRLGDKLLTRLLEHLVCQLSVSAGSETNGVEVGGKAHRDFDMSQCLEMVVLEDC